MQARLAEVAVLILDHYLSQRDIWHLHAAMMQAPSVAKNSVRPKSGRSFVSVFVRVQRPTRFVWPKCLDDWMIDGRGPTIGFDGFFGV